MEPGPVPIVERDMNSRFRRGSAWPAQYPPHQLGRPPFQDEPAGERNIFGGS